MPVVNQGSATAGALASALGCTVIKTYDGATRRGGFPAGWMGPAGAVNSFPRPEMTDQDEIARLLIRSPQHGALAALEAKQGRKFVSPPPVERGVTIIEIQTSVPCELPDAEQMRQSADIVLRQFPQLAPSYRHGAPRWERDRRGSPLAQRILCGVHGASAPWLA